MLPEIEIEKVRKTAEIMCESGDLLLKAALESIKGLSAHPDYDSRDINSDIYIINSFQSSFIKTIDLCEGFIDQIERNVKMQEELNDCKGKSTPPQ